MSALSTAVQAAVSAVPGVSWLSARPVVAVPGQAWFDDNAHTLFVVLSVEAPHRVAPASITTTTITAALASITNFVSVSPVTDRVGFGTRSAQVATWVPAGLPGIGGVAPDDLSSDTMAAIAAAQATVNSATYAPLADSLAITRRGGALLPSAPVGTRTAWPTALSNGTDTGCNTFLQHYLPGGITELRFVYVNSYGAGETLGTDTIPIRVGVGLPDGTIRPVFFRGARAGSVEPGAILVSDPIPVDGIAYVVSRTNISVSSGAKWVTSFPDASGRAAEGAEKGTSITDKSLTGTISSGGATGVPMYGPSAVIGRQSGGNWTRLPQIGAVGDSILFGQGDGMGDVPAGGVGFFERAINNVYGFVTCGSPTETIAQFLVSTGHAIRLALMQGMAAILAEHGCNDVTGGASFSTMQSRMISYWTRLNSTGAKIWQITLTPKSTSTDGWTTTANQTTDASNSVRVQVNNWIRDGAPMLNGSGVATGSSAAGTLRAGTTGHPLAGYFEVADQVESARDSGLWKPDPLLRNVTDAAMTSGSDQLGSLTAGFSATDVKLRRARVVGAGSAGTTLVSTIRAYPGGTNVNVSNNASTTVTGAAATIFRQSTADGVHPDWWIAQAMASAIDLTKLTVIHAS
jgi:hypothetical protein